MVPVIDGSTYTESPHPVGRTFISGQERNGSGVLLGDRADIAAHVDRVLGPVLAYDAERGTE
ncbi:hypothetical protein ACFCZ6_37605, partial [Streptomyces hydrogenans]|uniref:hypothetical protein n=1 Tax=Streptomyces hydrogenans TaxID=1873719 RepID=UPI0035D712B7